MRERVLLTGVGGSIGCHVLAHLLHNTARDVVGVDSFRHKGLTDRVAHMLDGHPEWRSRVTVLAHDLTAPFSAMLVKRIGYVSSIINVASLSDVHESILDPVPFVQANMAMQLNVLEFARQLSLRTFLQVSTDEVYGPTDGTYAHQEWSPILPSNPYSASKASQEAICVSYWRSYAVPVVIVNLMNNFGEMQSPSKFPAIVQRKVRRGETVDIHVDGDGVPGSRWYIHSRNSADAMLHLLKYVNPPLYGDGAGRPQRFNIVGDRQVDNLELAKTIAEVVGKPLSYRTVPADASRPGHDAHYGLDGAKLAALGWKPPVSFEESMRRTVEWYEEHPEWLEAR